MYAKDISKKIRATIDNKRINGQFIGAFPPYGYAKDKENRNRLVIDETAAKIVRRIFDMYINGISMSHITRILNDESIPSPNEYKKQTGTYSNANAKFGIWTQQTVKSILSNPTYRGNMTQGKSVKINYKTNKFKKIRKENWIVAKNTHEPAVESETFDIVQTMLSKYASVDYGSAKAEHLFKGLLFCGDCGKPLTFRRGNKKEFIIICSNNARNGACTRHQVYEKELNELVLNDLKAISEKLLNSEEFAKQLENDIPKAKIDPAKKELGTIDKKLNEIKHAIKSLYTDKARGIIAENDFLEIMKAFNDEREVLSKRKSAYVLKLEEKKPYDTDYIKLIQEVITFKITNKTLLTRLIDRIEVFEMLNGTRHSDKRIKVYYAFRNPF